MHVVMSTLARKVFDQTELDITVVNAWWVEKKLQAMQINGLVKMIRESRKADPSYIDGYVLKYKWAKRINPINIDECMWIFEVIQNFNVDFPWGMWQELKTVDVKHVDLFVDAVKYTANSGVNSLPYAMAIYNSNLLKIVTTCNMISNQISESQKILSSEQKNITNKSKLEWNKIQDYI